VILAPANNAINAALPVILKWKAAARATSYDVYLGTTAPPPLVGSATATSYTPIPGSIATGTTYFWVVVAKNAGGTSSSPTWKFKTKLAPAAPTSPVPANLATQVSRTPALQWKPAAGATSYDVYLGTVSTLPNPAAASNVSGTAFTPSSPLFAKKKYFWKVVAKSATGQTKSVIWSFTTQ
jgi:hypothetical protein